MNISISIQWLLPAWGIVSGLYFVAAYAYLGKRTGFSFWRTWLATGDNLKTERQFAKEIRGFPVWNLGYQLIKVGTVCVVIALVIIISRPFWR